MLPKVLFDTQPVQDLLTHEGVPVWPVSDDLDLRALHEAAKICGVEICSESGRPGAIPPASDSEVVALGEDAENAGRLYAHLTQRRFRSVPTLEGFEPVSRTSVLVLHTRCLHSDFLDRLYPPREGVPAPGLICASTPEDLRRQALVRAVSTLPGGLPRPHRIDLLPSLSFDLKERAEWILAGKEASPEQVRKLLACGAGVLTVRTHSDGVDAMLGPSLVLCPFDLPLTGVNNTRKPRCLLTQYCHRCERPIEEAWAEGKLISPVEMCARIFLFDTCRGLLQPDGVIDSSWGYFHVLLRNYRIGAILTTWNTNYSTGREIARLSRMIAAGVPLGTALSRYLNSTPLRRRIRMCLFGDPRMRLPQTASWKLAAEPWKDRGKVPSQVISAGRGSRRTGRHPEEEGGYRGELELARRAITGIRLALDEVMDASAGRALTTVTNYLRAERGEPGAVPTSGSAMRAALLDYLLWRGPGFQSDWISFAEELHVEADGVCPFCGRRTSVIVARLGAIGVTDRRLNSCPRCGRLEDVPVSSDLRLHLRAPRTLTLTGTLPKEGSWCAGVALCSALQAESTALSWPAGRACRPSRTCRIRGALPLGPFTIMVILVSGETIHELSLFTWQHPDELR